MGATWLQYAEHVLATLDLANVDAVGVHGVRAAGGAGTDLVIDNAAPEHFSTYFRQKAGAWYVAAISPRPGPPSSTRPGCWISTTFPWTTMPWPAHWEEN